MHNKICPFISASPFLIEAYRIKLIDVYDIMVVDYMIIIGIRRLSRFSAFPHPGIKLGKLLRKCSRNEILSLI